MSLGGEVNDTPDHVQAPLEHSVDTGVNRFPDPAVNSARLKEVLDLGEELPTRPATDTIEAVPFHKQVKENPDNG